MFCQPFAVLCCSALVCRTMRRLPIQRLRCDIADFDASGVEGLQGGRAPWVAIGKHLCGAATDFTLRCCAREHSRRSVGTAAVRPAHQQQQQQQSPAEERQRGGAAAGAPEAAATAAGAIGAAAAQAATAEPVLAPEAAAAAAAAAAVAALGEPPGGPAGASEGVAAGSLRGLAVATCCHHRCSWRHYVGQGTLREAGFSPEEFELISWMTGEGILGRPQCGVLALPAWSALLGVCSLFTWMSVVRWAGGSGDGWRGKVLVLCCRFRLVSAITHLQGQGHLALSLGTLNRGL
jgi:hypothetical protein